MAAGNAGLAYTCKEEPPSGGRSKQMRRWEIHYAHADDAPGFTIENIRPSAGAYTSKYIEPCFSWMRPKVEAYVSAVDELGAMAEFAKLFANGMDAKTQRAFDRAAEGASR
jgi:hypothetical protein